MIVFLLIVYIVSYLFSPQSYEINQHEIIVNRVIKNVILSRSHIKNIAKLEDGKLIWSIRVFGVGGLSGYYGKFWNKEYGMMT